MYHPRRKRLAQVRTIIIDSNIHINNAGSDKFQAIDQIPTIIIFAKEVIISDNVTRLDAWIISGLNGGSGKINTCGYSHSAKALIATSDLTSDKCNSALYINGPVYATSAVLGSTEKLLVGDIIQIQKDDETILTLHVIKNQKSRK